MDRAGRRLLVVSHPSVIAVNQAVYLALMKQGWNPLLVVPRRWRHDYSSEAFAPQVLPGMEGRIWPLPILLPGRPQRHVYLARPDRIIRRLAPAAVFLEQETFSCAAMQWGSAAWRAGIPFGVQAAENIDRPLPGPVRAMRGWVLRHAGFVAARSPMAERRALDWGATGRTGVVPHAVPGWLPAGRAERAASGIFTVGFAGRLVAEKGVWDLVEAARRLPGPVRLLFVGDGPLRTELARARVDNGTIDLWTGLPHDRMPEAYAQMDVLALPSRTTRRWTEQFGRVLVEALWCGVPVVSSDSGEMPWVVRTTGGGLVYREADVGELSGVLAHLRAQPAERDRLAEQGRAVVERMFSVDASASDLAALLSLALADP